MGFNLDIIVGLSGRYNQSWDEKMRPQPRNSRLINLREAQTSTQEYHCIITHNITDLLDAKGRIEPKILVLHSTIESRSRKSNVNLSPEEMKSNLARYVRLANIHVVAISKLKGESWGQTDDIVSNCVNPADYLPYEGHIAKGLRVSNFINKRERVLLWDFHQNAFADIPVNIVGHNPEMVNVHPSQNWQNLKEIYQSHRFYIHTAHPELEDGYNLATLEAMAAGLPVLGNNHPTSIITHGVDGFLSDDPKELSHCAKILLNDRNMALKMGEEAQKTVANKFSHNIFKERFLNSIHKARRNNSLSRE